MKQPKEQDIQRVIIEWIQWRGGVATKFNNVGIKKVNGRYIPPKQKGISDLLVCWKGLYFAIEVKRKGNKPTPDQQAFLDRIIKAGGKAFVACSVEDVERELK